MEGQSLKDGVTQMENPTVVPDPISPDNAVTSGGSSGSKLLFVVLVIALVGVGGVVGFLLLQDNNTEETTTQEITQETTEETTIAVDPYQGWNTYTEEYLPVEFRYPESFVVDEQDSQQGKALQIMKTDKSFGYQLWIQDYSSDYAGSGYERDESKDKEYTIDGKKVTAEYYSLSEGVRVGDITRETIREVFHIDLGDGLYLYVIMQIDQDVDGEGTILTKDEASFEDKEIGDMIIESVTM